MSTQLVCFGRTPIKRLGPTDEESNIKFEICGLCLDSQYLYLILQSRAAKLLQSLSGSFSIAFFIAWIASSLIGGDDESQSTWPLTMVASLLVLLWMWTIRFQEKVDSYKSLNRLLEKGEAVRFEISSIYTVEVPKKIGRMDYGKIKIQLPGQVLILSLSRRKWRKMESFLTVTSAPETRVVSPQQ